MRTRDTELNKALSRATLPDAGSFGDLFEQHVQGHLPMIPRLRNLVIGSALLAEDPNSGTDNSLAARIKRISESALEAGWVPEGQQGLYRDLVRSMERVNATDPKRKEEPT